MYRFHSQTVALTHNALQSNNWEQEPLITDYLISQTVKKICNRQRFGIMRLTEVIGKHVLSETRSTWTSSGPNELTTHSSLATAWAAHHQCTTCLGSSSTVQTMKQLGENPLATVERLILQKTRCHLYFLWQTESSYCITQSSITAHRINFITYYASLYTLGFAKT